LAARFSFSFNGGGIDFKRDKQVFLMNRRYVMATAASRATPVQLTSIKSKVKGQIRTSRPMRRSLVHCSVLAFGNQPDGLNSKTNHGLFSGADWPAHKFSRIPEQSPSRSSKRPGGTEQSCARVSNPLLSSVSQCLRGKSSCY
jgi:hypothetical protein